MVFKIGDIFLVSLTTLNRAPQSWGGKAHNTNSLIKTGFYDSKFYFDEKNTINVFAGCVENCSFQKKNSHSKFVL
jgi:hypothetical protein